ncbi:nucleoside hydrolase [Ilumatobacter coccineus]|jgi:inosine-uridine nucleoside N-ribohydrolase|uniref:Putative pyrimidine-specific ribonucleoside hydrolase n=1 Tax=Ilumatobacter coccineus (strain NBRC 103263 / KCTC 29153 / YM16-304) TaxID=1313172 RepID=A0A6C7E890_ILUCY|nr:nucleoside hydrolase [Ilumatobacter coccineus]BAN01365.1 putative pyrimidine-specific ribonucleoside hydrolase [Ilumatobacter coccineus YM16-304]
MPEMSTRPKMIIDCDPGHDDAVAIVTAAHFADVRGIVTVAGNAPLDRTTHNALVMRDLLELDTPVHSGAARPLIAPARDAGFVHGESGLDGAELPEPTTPLDSTDGVDFIIDTCRAEDDVWLVPMGPLTNIALALRQAPDLVDRVAGISLMGGGTFGNRTAAAEFNIWADPEAAAIVFGSQVRPLIMAGLDVTHQFQVTRDRIEQTRALPGRVASILADLFDFFSGTYLRRHDDGSIGGAALHDPLAVLAVTHPALFDREQRHVVVETKGEHTAGMTVIDGRALIERDTANCDVLTQVDHHAAFTLVLEAIEATA